MFVELFGPMVGLEQEWRRQGATRDELSLEAFDWDFVPVVQCGGNTGIQGGAEVVTLEETPQYLIQRDALGRRTKLYKDVATIALPMDFPVRDMDGELDLPHVRNAIARIPQSRIPDLSEDDLEKLQEKARELLTEATRKVDVFTKSIPLIKADELGDERFVLGVVLEPDVVDAQGDIYSVEEVRQAAHRFMEEFGGLGLMHRFRVNDQVKVLESYLAPADVAIGETQVRKGTWLLAVRVLADELWNQVKDGTLGGFSIGGSARRSPGAVPDRGDQKDAA